MGRPACVHCRVHVACRARGLCWGCSLDPAVRALYPMKSGAYALPHVGLEHDESPRPLPRTPTDHPPGSPGKIAVLAQRAERGLQLFHPDDAL